MASVVIRRSHPPYGGLACGAFSELDTRAIRRTADRHDFPPCRRVPASRRVARFARLLTHAHRERILQNGRSASTESEEMVHG